MSPITRGVWIDVEIPANSHPNHSGREDQRGLVSLRILALTPLPACLASSPITRGWWIDVGSRPTRIQITRGVKTNEVGFCFGVKIPHFEGLIFPPFISSWRRQEEELPQVHSGKSRASGSD
jgi:hypothetical protein